MHNKAFGPFHHGKGKPDYEGEDRNYKTGNRARHPNIEQGSAIHDGGPQPDNSAKGSNNLGGTGNEKRERGRHSMDPGEQIVPKFMGHQDGQ